MDLICIFGKCSIDEGLFDWFEYFVLWIFYNRCKGEYKFFGCNGVFRRSIVSDYRFEIRVGVVFD